MWWSLPALATTWFIPGDYPDIGSAVGSGLVIDGDTLKLGQGVHTGFDFSNTMLLSIVIDGDDTSTTFVESFDAGIPVFRFQDLDVSVTNMTIDGMVESPGVEALGNSILLMEDVKLLNGYRLGTPSSSFGGNLLLRGTTRATISGEVAFGSAPDGAGVAVLDTAELTLSSAVIHNNTATGRGGGVYVADGASLISSAALLNNTALQGGGVYSAGEATFANTLFLTNSADDGGGAFLEGGPLITFTDSVFRENTASNLGGGISGLGQFDFTRVLFHANTAHFGGGVHLQPGSPTTHFRSVAFCNNDADTSGSAIDLENGASINIQNGLFYQNGSDSSVRGAGGMTIENALFHDNPNLWAVTATGPLIMHGVVFSGSGLSSINNVSVTTNAFQSTSMFSGINPALQLITDPIVNSTFICSPGIRFPYATSPDLLDQGGGTFDLDGSPADIGHLGGPLLHVGFFGADHDGDNALVHVDCDDTDPEVNPSAAEVCDNIDNDCDALIDESGDVVYLDADGDLWGDSTPLDGCPNATRVANTGDCDDNDPSIYPGATETCNNVDDDCDGVPDQGLPLQTFYLDDDADTFGAGAPTTSCQSSIPGFVTNSTDCDDQEPQVYPGATEICNGIDDDCDGSTDEDQTLFFWYEDLDGDGFGDEASMVEQCSAPSPSHADRRRLRRHRSYHSPQRA